MNDVQDDDETDSVLFGGQLEHIELTLISIDERNPLFGLFWITPGRFFKGLDGVGLATEPYPELRIRFRC